MRDSLRRRLLLLLAFPCLTITLLSQRDAPQAPPDTPAPAFRAGVDVVTLDVTVTDATGHYILNLDSAELSVFEDGVKQEIAFFTRGRQPIALSLLLDSSASMESQLPTLQNAATQFIQRLTPRDLAQVIDFDSRVDIRQPFTSNQTDLAAAVYRMRAGGSTSLYNAVYIALKELAKIRAVKEEDVRRQALVVFSDGEDTSSLVAFDDVLNLAKRSDTSIYTIALRGPEPQQTKGFREAEYVMRSLALETGGRSFFPNKIDDLAGVYAQIADELTSKYTVGYTSSNARRDGGWRRLAVRASRPDIVVRTRSGYYASTSR